MRFAPIFAAGIKIAMREACMRSRPGADESVDPVATRESKETPKTQKRKKNYESTGETKEQGRKKKK